MVIHGITLENGLDEKHDDEHEESNEQIGSGSESSGHFKLLVRVI